MKHNCIAKKKFQYIVFFLSKICYICILIINAKECRAQSEVYLSIKTGGSEYIGIGIGGFEAYGDTTGIITRDSTLVIMVKNTFVDDLNRSSLFQVKNLSDSLQAVKGDMFAQWRAAGAQYYVFGAEKIGSNTITVTVIDLKTAATVLNEEYRIESQRPWYTAHVIVDDMIELFTGLRGSTSSQIAFMSPYRGDSHEVYLVDADGRGRKQLTFTKTLKLSPAWSLDGKQIAFSSLIDLTWSLMTVNVNTGQSLDISTWKGLNITPSWSQVDTDIIAFSSNRDGNSEIYTCRSDGKQIRRLTNHYGIDSSPSWSPDGQKIAFTSDRSGQPAIYIMNRDGSDVHRLTFNINSYEDLPCWSPRGDRIAFVILFDRGFDIATVSPSGDDIVMLTSGEGSNENPRWSPDGLRIIFTSTRLGGKNLFIMNRDGSDVRPLTQDSLSFSPSWSPAFSGNDIRVTSRRQGR